MVKNIIGVILGYLTMFVFIFITFTIAYLLMGTGGAFLPDSYQVSALWIIISIILGIIAAVLGGYVCILISKNTNAVKVLAGLVLILGLLMAIPVLTDSDQSQSMVLEGDVGNFEAMQQAKQPPWLAFLNPLIGAVGVIFGSRLKAGEIRSS